MLFIELYPQRNKFLHFVSREMPGAGPGGYPDQPPLNGVERIAADMMAILLPAGKPCHPSCRQPALVPTFRRRLFRLVSRLMAALSPAAARRVGIMAATAVKAFIIHSSSSRGGWRVE
jgi:hypothetical protein